MHWSRNSYQLWLAVCALSIVLFAGSSCVSIIKNPNKNLYVASHLIQTDARIRNEKISPRELASKLHKTTFSKTKKTFIVSVHSNPAPIDTAKLNGNLNAIFETFQKYGYMDVTGSYTLERIWPSTYKTKVVYHIRQGPLYLLSSAASLFEDKLQDSLFLEVVKSSEFLRPCQMFDYDQITLTLDQIQEQMHNYGYATFSKDYVRVLIDTSYQYLPSPPFRFRNVPLKSFQLYFSLDKEAPPSVFKRHKVEEVFVRLLRTSEDTAVDILDSNVFYQDKLVDGKRMFNASFIKRQIPGGIVGQYYTSKDVAFISNNFWNARSFSLVTQFPEYTSDSTMHIHYELSPRKKMSTGIFTDFSFNDGSGASTLVGLAQNQLIDLSVSGEFGITNLFRQSVQYSFFVKAGVQLSPNREPLLSSTTFSVSNVWRIPGFWLAGFYLPNKQSRVSSKSTNFSIEGLFFNRTGQFSLFNLRLYNSFSWEYKGYHFNLYPINAEFYQFHKQESFDLSLENSIKEVQNAYKDGNILSAIFSISKTWQPRPSLSLKLFFSVEETGLYGELYNTLFKSSHIPIFLRNEVNFSLLKVLNSKSSFAARIYYGNNIYYEKDQTTPYFRKFFSGGPYSMRGWQSRTLGFGSINQASEASFPSDKLGDIKLEMSAEYRFHILAFSNAVLEGAVFVDVGSLWYKTPGWVAIDRRGYFNFGRILEDLAMDGGLGLRAKIGFFIIRLDYGYRLKDPQYTIPSFGFHRGLIDGGAVQIGVGYPF